MRRIPPGATVLLLLALAVAASAAEPARPTLALVGGRIIDGYEGRPIEDGVVLIAGDRITAVGTRSQITVPPGTPVIDTRGMSLLPGMADMHVHLMILGHGDYEHWDTAYRSRFRAEIMPAAAKQLLVSGVTFARELGGPLEDLLEVNAGSRRGRSRGRGSSSPDPSSSTSPTATTRRNSGGE
jgi:imidazolonepropionase-like amidohydrolase